MKLKRPGPTTPMCSKDRFRSVQARKLAALTTFLPPPLQKVCSLGADLVMHSATKYMGGHSDAIGGVLGGRHEHLEAIEGFRRRTGGILAPDTAWLLARSMKTLAVRVRQQCETAARLARFLVGKVAKVHYPGLASHPQNALAKRQMASGGGMISFVVRGGLPAARALLETVKVFVCAESLGGVESLIEHPALMTHGSVPAPTRAQLGISDGLIRISVGLEDLKDLRADLASALDAAGRTVR